ncbi:MAG: archaemetzincin family Zn-dependent metalloprotease [Deltaproteobacteria bacterium]|nr:archaemetzincin family Zn-dependent metalloprotease [Deltaproteobacteria bacterium]
MILLLLFGKIDDEALFYLKNLLEKEFEKKVEVGKGFSVPESAFNSNRGQYYATFLINSIMDRRELDRYERILGIIDKDLYAAGLNFVFGEAGAKAAVISLTRLKPSYYGLPEDRRLFLMRAATEAVHELGHTFGLNHCADSYCVMYFSNNIADTDRKGAQFCERCRKRLKDLTS